MKKGGGGVGAEFECEYIEGKERNLNKNWVELRGKRAPFSEFEISFFGVF